MPEEILDALSLVQALCGALLVCVYRKEVCSCLRACWLQARDGMKMRAVPSDPLDGIVNDMTRQWRLFCSSRIMVAVGWLVIPIGLLHVVAFKFNPPARPVAADAAIRLIYLAAMAGAILPRTAFTVYSYAALATVFGVVRAFSAQHYLELVTGAAAAYAVCCLASIGLLDWRQAAISHGLVLLARLSATFMLLEDPGANACTPVGYGFTRRAQNELIVVAFNVCAAWCVERSFREYFRKSLRGQAALGEVKSIWSLADAVCDCVVRLDRDFNVLGPYPKLASMLQNQRGSMQGANLTHYMSDSDKGRFEQFIDDSRRSKPSSRDPETIAQALHITLRDAIGLAIAVEVFHVLLQGLDGTISHIVGLREHSNICNPAPSAGGLGTVGRGNQPAAGSASTDGLPLSATRGASGRAHSMEDTIAPLLSEATRDTRLASLDMKFKMLGHGVSLVEFQVAFFKAGAEEEEQMMQFCPPLDSLMPGNEARQQNFEQFISDVAETYDHSWRPEFEDVNLSLMLPHLGKVSTRRARKVILIEGEDEADTVSIEFDQPTLAASSKENDVVDRPKRRLRSSEANRSARGHAEDKEGGGGAAGPEGRLAL
eukprot:TRINITY_DN37116_c0_g1_i3.p1 TRINITY_DN37116_c0_g1~~TRINITY_DN37116_c0_g1_i3.p1  ORF type:complete len:600 (+),score=84.70 TRINITY_DN37116_c0_g1_i3:71-1870(+)